MSDDHSARPELARPYFTRQAQVGRRVVFAWRPADASPHNPLTTPWPDADELVEGVEFADEAALTGGRTAPTILLTTTRQSACLDRAARRDAGPPAQSVAFQRAAGGPRTW